MMQKLTQYGTLALLLACALVACGEARHAHDASTDNESHSSSGSGDSAVAGGSPATANIAESDGGEATICLPHPCPSATSWNADKCGCDSASQDADACETDADCTLVGRGCCYCWPTLESTIAVHRDRAREVQTAQCPPDQPKCSCPYQPLDPLAPILRAVCVEHKCSAVNLRALDLSMCASDSDCVAQGRACCGPTSSDPADYVAINKSADDSILQCFPAPSCLPPTTTPMIPPTFCASDGHCAVRKHEKARGLVSTTCYSPNQNVDSAFDDGATGCECGSNEPSVCRKDSQGRYVGFICDPGNSWQAVNDGPCGKKP